MPTSPLSAVIQHLLADSRREGAGMTDGELLTRFQKSRDGDALAALVQRHASMVWGVCCRLLNHHDAEDAFQATFLVLTRKAPSVPREAVANWLYGVARQTAVRVKAAAAKRGRREVQVMTMPEPTVPEVCDSDVQAVIDEELSRLPDHYRGIVILCDLEGLTRKETARQLGIPEGSVASRLARARAMLARRLSNRGMVLSGGSVAAVLSVMESVSSAPPVLVTSTIRAASVLATGRAAGIISAKVAALTEGVVKTMFVTKLKAVLSAVLVLGVLATGATALTYRIAEGGWHGAGAATPLGVQPVTSPVSEKSLVTSDTQKAIDAGLEFLAKNQADDGSWNTNDYRGNVAATAVAGRAFLAAGYQPGDGSNGRRLANAIEYVLRTEVNGLLAQGKSAPMYEHGYGVHFLAEAYGKVADKTLKDRMKATLTRAVKVIVDGQNREGGWHYRPNSKDADLSVTCCELRALTVASAAGFEVPPGAVERGIGYVLTCRDKNVRFHSMPNAPSTDAATFEYTAVAISTLSALQFRDDKATLDAATKYIREFKSAAVPDAVFYGAYAAAAPLVKAGGKDWDAWYSGVRADLLGRRNKDDVWGDSKDSASFNTALAVIILQARVSDARLLGEWAAEDGRLVRFRPDGQYDSATITRAGEQIVGRKPYTADYRPIGQDSIELFDPLVGEWVRLRLVFEEKRLLLVGDDGVVAQRLTRQQGDAAEGRQPKKKSPAKEEPRMDEHDPRRRNEDESQPPVKPNPIQDPGTMPPAEGKPRPQEPNPKVPAPDDKRVGTLKGRFVFDGNPPPRTDLFPALSAVDPARPMAPGGQFNGVESVYRDFLSHGIRPKTDDSSLLVGKDGGIANVVVWATSKGIPWKAPDDLTRRPVTIKLKGGNYSPRVTAAAVGQPVLVENHDPVGFHFRVEPFNPRNKPANQLLKADSADTPLRLTWEQAEPRPTKYESNLGPWATGWVFVHTNSFVAVSGPDGSFAIPELPPGEWEFRAWHERGGYLKHWSDGKFKLNVKAGDNALGAIKLKPELFGEASRPNKGP